MNTSNIIQQTNNSFEEELPLMVIKNKLLKTLIFIFFFSSLFILNSCAIFIGREHEGRSNDRHHERHEQDKHQEHNEHNEHDR